MKILVIQMKMIGDVLTSSILFEALRKEYPNAQLDYLIYRHTIPVVENHPDISNFIIFEPEEHKGLPGLITLGRKLKANDYDIVIDAYSKPYSAFISFLTGANKKIGLKKWYTKPVFDHVFKNEKTARTTAGLAIENRLKLLQPLGLKNLTFLKPKIYLNSEEINWAKNYLSSRKVDMSKPVYMISVLGSSEQKTYPENFMAEVLNFIASKKDCTLLYNYIPAQKPQVDRIVNLLSEEARKMSRPEIFGKSLREFLALSSQCTALIGNEGGAINMAKALAIPTFAIFSPQITKEAWSSFEGDRNYSVHLHDYHPEKNDYAAFQPQLFQKKLKDFVDVYD